MMDPVTAPRFPAVLIVSVGGSPEPIAKSLQYHRPRHVVFFASEKSVETIGRIKRDLQAIPLAFTNDNVIVRDEQNLSECYARALECADRALATGCAPSEVKVDITGGTKLMSVGLALATVGRGFTFSYVGGHARTKHGLGVVVTGAEALRLQEDPYRLFAVLERRQIALYFERYQFEAARTVLSGLLARFPAGPERLAFAMLDQVANGYARWERFQYREALRELKQAWRTWSQAVQANPSIRYAEACSVLEQNVAWLERLQTATEQFTRSHADWVADMIANAERRAQEGKYDDAVVRLYRALELGAQAAVYRRLGCGTGEIPVEHVPGALREDFVRRGYEVTPGTFQLPLEASYRLLHALGEPEGLQFVERREEIKKIQSARNFSMLAHGMQPTTREAYESLHALIRGLLSPSGTIVFLRLPEA